MEPQDTRHDADEKMFTIASGALVLSVTFWSSIVKEDTTALWLLGVSWVFLAVCIVCYPFYLNLPQSIRNVIYKVTQEVFKGEPTIDPDLLAQQVMEKPRVKVTTYRALVLVRICWITYTLGMVALVFFGLANLWFRIG